MIIQHNCTLYWISVLIWTVVGCDNSSPQSAQKPQADMATLSDESLSQETDSSSQEIDSSTDAMLDTCVRAGCPSVQNGISECVETVCQLRCNTGFVALDGVCVDVDECQMGRGGCHEYAVCENMMGGWQCTCKTGYQGNGENCTDIDECDGSDCGPGGTCLEVDGELVLGQYTCRCAAGHEGGGINTRCAVTLCAANEYVSTNVCVPCRSGFENQLGDDASQGDTACEDVNECDRANGGCEQLCTNFVGSFGCGCEVGFLLNVDAQTCRPDAPPFWDANARLSTPSELPSAVVIEWPAAQDDVGVLGYQVFMDGALIFESAPNVRRYVIRSLSYAAEHLFEVYAVDTLDQQSEIPLSINTFTDLVAHWAFNGNGMNRYLPQDLAYARDEGIDVSPQEPERRALGQTGHYPGQMFGNYTFMPDRGIDHGAIFLGGPMNPGSINLGNQVGSEAELTVSFWFKTPVVAEQVVISKLGVAEHGTGWEIRLLADGQVEFRVGSETNFSTVTTQGGFDKFTGTHNPNAAYASGAIPRHLNWTHIAASFAEGTGRIYVNGHLSNTVAGITQSTEELDTATVIGVSVGEDDAEDPDRLAYRGFLDDLKLFRRALDPESIRTLATIPLPSKHDPNRLDAEGRPTQTAINYAEEPIEGKFRIDRTLPPNGVRPDYVAELMALTDDEARYLVPKNNPNIKQLCPITGAGSGNQSGIHRQYSWSPDHPDQIVALTPTELENPIECEDPANYGVGCNAIRWGDPSRPIPGYEAPHGVDEFVNASGQPISIPYFIHPNPEGNQSNRFHHQAQIDFQKYWWLKDALIATAHAYYLDGDEAKAHRVAVVLDEFAKAIPGWLPSIDYKIAPTWYQSSTEYPDPPADAFLLGQGLFAENYLGSVNEATYFAQFLDLIYGSEAIRQLSREQGMGEYGVLLRIEENILRDSMNIIFSQSWARIIMTNVPRFIENTTLLARYANRPEWAHWMQDFILDTPYGEWGFTSDMHNMDATKDTAVLAYLEIVRVLLNYEQSDPNYINPLSGLSMSDVDVLTLFPELMGVGVELDEPPVKFSMLGINRYLRLPHGAVAQINDTAHQYPERAPDLPFSTSENFYGWGHASLGDGTDDQQIQAHLHYQLGGGHAHADGLGLILFANGHELLGDIGYQRNALRKFRTATLVHNTVVIDRVNQREPRRNKRLLLGNAELFVPDMPGLKVVRVDNQKVYEQASVYRRTLLLVTHDLDRPYLLDVFEVEGGHTHDLHLRGALGVGIDQDQHLPADAPELVTNLPINGDPPIQIPAELDEDDSLWGNDGSLLEGDEVWSNVNYDSYGSYGLVRRVLQWSAPDYFITDFKYVDAPDMGSRHHVVTDGLSDVFMGQSPRLRQYTPGDMCGNHHICDANKYDEWTPHLVLRNRSDQPQQRTVYVVVHEPYKAGTPNDMAVQRLDTGVADSVGLQIQMGTRTDTILISLLHETVGERQVQIAQNMEANGLSVSGIIGMHTQDGDEEKGWLVGGTTLTKGTVELLAPVGRYTGTIESGTIEFIGDDSDAFVADSNLPQGDFLGESMLHVSHGRSIDGGKTFVHIDQDTVMHAYPIECVETVGPGRQRIHLDGNHGLLIDGDRTVERNYPFMTFDGFNIFEVFTRRCTDCPPPDEVSVLCNTGQQ